MERTYRVYLGHQETIEEAIFLSGFQISSPNWRMVDDNEPANLLIVFGRINDNEPHTEPFQIYVSSYEDLRFIQTHGFETTGWSLRNMPFDMIFIKADQKTKYAQYIDTTNPNYAMTKDPRCSNSMEQIKDVHHLGRRIGIYMGDVLDPEKEVKYEPA